MILREIQRSVPEVRRKTTADPSTPFAAKSTANFAQDDSAIVMRISETGN
jgi:hypothetical protein